MQREASPNKGHVLIGVLLVTCIASATIATIFSVHRYFQHSSLINHHAIAARTLSHAITEGELTADSKNRDRIECLATSGASGSVSIEKEICLLKAQKEKTAAPLIDFEDEFKNFTDCTKRTPVSTKGLSSGSSYAEYTCSSLQGASIHILRENIDIDSLTLPTTKNATKISTPGFLRIQKVLTLTNDTVILSGGDIILEKISSLSSSPLRLTLISATGFVSVRSLTGKISLLSISSRGAYTPTTPNLPPHPMPKLLSILPVGWVTKNS